jgi:hypothetical protein
MKSRAIVAGILALAAVATSGAALAVSGAGAIILQFPIGARYNAMGESGTALAQDATATWWNPGGLAYMSDRSTRRDLHFMQSKLAPDLADDIGLYWIGYAAPWGQDGVIGFSFNYLSMGEQQATDENQGDKGTFSSNMFAFSLVYGYRLLDNVGIGLGIKYFRDKLADDEVLQDVAPGGGSGDSFGVDFGLLYKLDYWPFARIPGLSYLWQLPVLRGFGPSNWAISIQNIGPDITHVDADQSDPMPRKVTFGAAVSVLRSDALKIILSGDYLVPMLKWSEADNDYGFGLEFDEEEYGYGSEVNYDNKIFLRMGYKAMPAGDIRDMTWGFGFDLSSLLGKAITFDYGSVPQARGLDKVNRLSLGFRF